MKIIKFLIVLLLFVPFLISSLGTIALLIMIVTRKAPVNTIPVLILTSAIAVYLFWLLKKSFKSNDGIVSTKVAASTQQSRWIGYLTGAGVVFAFIVIAILVGLQLHVISIRNWIGSAGMLLGFMGLWSSMRLLRSSRSRNIAPTATRKPVDLQALERFRGSYIRTRNLILLIGGLSKYLSLWDMLGGLTLLVVVPVWYISFGIVLRKKLEYNRS